MVSKKGTQNKEFGKTDKGNQNKMAVPLDICCTVSSKILRTGMTACPTSFKANGNVSLGLTFPLHVQYSFRQHSFENVTLKQGRSFKFLLA
jgi:hypothetical protein